MGKNSEYSRRFEQTRTDAHVLVTKILENPEKYEGVELQVTEFMVRHYLDELEGLNRERHSEDKSKAIETRRLAIVAEHVLSRRLEAKGLPYLVPKKDF